MFSATSPSQVAQALSDAIASALKKPFAWANGPYVTTTGTPVVLDAAGSFDGDGTIVKYEWDVDGDGVFDTSSSEPTYTYTYNSTFSGTVSVRVTDNDGNTSIATAIVDASADGDEVPDAADNCPTVSNHGQSDFDADGIGDVCDATPFDVKKTSTGACRDRRRGEPLARAHGGRHRQGVGARLVRPARQRRQGSEHDAGHGQRSHRRDLRRRGRRTSRSR